MGKKSVPQAPDYTAAAEKTAGSNQQAQTRADWTNRPTQTDIYGNTTSWKASAATDPSTGQPITQWAQSTQLAPQQQAMLDQGQRIQGGMMTAGEGMLGRAQDAVSKPFDTSGMQGWAQGPQAGGLMAGNLTGAGQGIQGSLDTGSLGGMPQADDAGRQRIENALFDRMAPQHQQAQAGLETKLQNMGLTRGSEAWNRESQRLGDQQSRERFNALEMGGQEQQRQFGMGMQGRQQGWNEMQGAGNFQNAAQAQGYGQRAGEMAQNFGQQAQAGQQNFQQGMAGSEYNNALRGKQMQEASSLRQMPLNELNAYLSGNQVQNPNFGSFNTSQSAGGANYSGAAANQYNAGLDAYNAKQATTQGLMSGLGGLASTGLMRFSDRRLKRNIERVGTTLNGLPVYTYRYVWGRKRHMGVMADEARKLYPYAVRKHWSGFLKVDYSKVA